MTRRVIMGGLVEVVHRLDAAGVNCEVWVDGSFVTEKTDPKDADIAVRVYGPDFDAVTDAVAQTVEWAGSDLIESHRIDGYYWAEWPDGHPQRGLGEYLHCYWAKWFGTSRGGSPKGIVVIRLGAGMP